MGVGRVDPRVAKGGTPISGPLSGPLSAPLSAQFSANRFSANRFSANRSSAARLLTTPVSAQAGLGRLTVFVFGMLCAAAVYSGYQILPFYYSYFELHNQMTAVIPKADLLKDKEIRRRLLQFIKETGIPADDKQLILERRDNKMRIRLAYDEVFYIPWLDHNLNLSELDVHVFPFNLDVSGAF